MITAPLLSKAFRGEIIVPHLPMLSHILIYRHIHTHTHTHAHTRGRCDRNTKGSLGACIINCVEIWWWMGIYFGGGELFRLGVIGYSFCMPNGPSDAIGRLAYVETPVPRNGFAQSHNNSL